MKNINNNRLWFADEGKTLRHIATNEVIGTGLKLGKDDSINNYEEVDLNEENDIEGILKIK